jgi:biopolymer transport protein ExbD
MASRKIPEINASSMADIAFLLLVFFLVTTTIQTDAGVSTVLPPFVPPDITFKENERNVCAIQINSNDQIRMRDKEVANVEDISDFVYRFMSNRGAQSDLSDSPDRAVVSLLNDNGTSYKTYLEVYDQVKMACDRFRNEVAQNKFGKAYKDLTDDQQREVRKEAPCKISEADPTDFGKKE